MNKVRSTIWIARSNTEDFYFDRVDREKEKLKQQIKKAEEFLNQLLRQNGEEENKLLPFQAPQNHAQLQKRLGQINNVIGQQKARRVKILTREFQRGYQGAMSA